MEKLINLIIFSFLISSVTKCNGLKVDGKFATIYFVFVSSCFGLVVIFNESLQSEC